MTSCSATSDSSTPDRTTPDRSTSDRYVIDRQHFQQLLDALMHSGYEVIGPTLRDQAIVYDTLTQVEEFPIGWTDEQEAGTYRLKPREDGALFGYAVGPQSWKKVLFPAQVKLWSAERQGRSVALHVEPPISQKRAFIGVRSCELHAIAIQDRVFLESDHVDPHYQAHRQNCFIVAVNCAQAGGTCFCVSMNTGPAVESGFDLALTEILQPDRHAFLVEVGSSLGAEILEQVTHRIANAIDQELAAQVVANTAQHMGRSMDTTNIKELLYQNLEHPQWNEVASRCLTCANCTLVCPTCFCSTVEDTTDLTGNHAERWRQWDSCFTMDFSYIHGGAVRMSAKSRYRQWMTHKLASWIDQFGTSGCVGCGRCITWCPVGIDITAEVRALRGEETTS
ncbi:4Fe-4S dicluster domain-containing protein [Alkalinema sp. FACHB-956]|uniref:4Fe-4S dicluster domain-containing protein n=1 Tax=Alkalinema sp. FACHB-956 TaxID=2692768 RepID=UPI001689C0BB|nr:4Fe-4S dicluster domain-containing protein [Alkalinema sp. FACHB-956]MBD2327976.1 4Fe-4S dicluster domain-containing protein [Alkalinema sp. FACHB-956]